MNGNRKINIYGGSCLFCGNWVEPKQGFIKMKNPHKGDMHGKPRETARKYGVLCKTDFITYKQWIKRNPLSAQINNPPIGEK